MGLENKSSDQQIGKEFVFSKLGKSLIAIKKINKNENFSIENLLEKFLLSMEFQLDKWLI